MAARNRGHDLTGDDFVGEFLAAPLADWASTFSRRFTGQCDDLANLFGGDGGGFTRTRGIGQALFEWQIGERDRRQGEPAGAPQARGIDLHTQEARDLGVIEADVGGENDTSVTILRGT